jgi:hypothetical protein
MTTILPVEDNETFLYSAARHLTDADGSDLPGPLLRKLVDLQVLTETIGKLLAA